MDAADRAGWTALMHAAKDGHATIVVALLCSRVNLYLKNVGGETALDIAKQGGYTEVVKLLIEAGNSNFIWMHWVFCRRTCYHINCWDPQAGYSTNVLFC